MLRHIAAVHVKIGIVQDLDNLRNTGLQSKFSFVSYHNNLEAGRVAYNYRHKGGGGPQSPPQIFLQVSMELLCRKKTLQDHKQARCGKGAGEEF
jgi:hypothetical protein